MKKSNHFQILQENIYKLICEFERELIRERTMVGLRRARSLGHIPGRKRNPVDVEELRKARRGGLSFAKLAEKFGVSSSTAHNIYVGKFKVGHD